MPKASMNKRALGDDKGEVEMKPNFMRFGEEWSQGNYIPLHLKYVLQSGRSEKKAERVLRRGNRYSTGSEVKK